MATLLPLNVTVPTQPDETAPVGRNDGSLHFGDIPPTCAECGRVDRSGEAARLIADMEEAQRRYDIFDDGVGRLCFRSVFSGDTADVWIPLQDGADEDGSDGSPSPTVLGSHARFPSEVYEAVASVWLGRREVRAIQSERGKAALRRSSRRGETGRPDATQRKGVCCGG